MGVRVLAVAIGGCGLGTVKWRSIMCYLGPGCATNRSPEALCAGHTRPDARGGASSVLASAGVKRSDIGSLFLVASPVARSVLRYQYR